MGHQQITVEGADEATVFYTVDTEYSPVYPLYKGEKPRQTTEKTIKSAITKGYETVKHTHISDYQTLYNRVKFTLSGDTTSEKLPTDIRVKQLQQGFTDVLGLRAYPTSGVRRGLSGMDRRFGRTRTKNSRRVLRNQRLGQPLHRKHLGTYRSR